MARTIDPYSWPFAVSPRHPAHIPCWIAMAVYAVGSISQSSGGEGLPSRALAVALTFMISWIVAARVASARARRQVDHARQTAEQEQPRA